jgi:NADPH:quinone reductase-like Zn-dependent oxidoreductase
VIATARPGDHARCLEQGASAVFDFGDPNLAGRVLDVAPGGVDIHWDTSGRMPLNAMEPMTASGGKIIVTAGRSRNHQKHRCCRSSPGTSA